MEDNKTLIRLAEDVTEVKTLLCTAVKQREEDKRQDKEERILRQGYLDKRLNGQDTRIKNIEDKIVKTETSITVAKRIVSGASAIMLAVIVFDWDKVATIWQALRAGE